MRQTPNLQNDTLGFCEKLDLAHSFEEAWGVYGSELKRFGLSQSFYGFLQSPVKNGVHEELHYFSSYNEGLLTAYEDQQCLNDDWSALHCQKSTNVIRWRVPRIMARLNERQLEIEKICWDYGHFNGLTIPLRGPMRGGWGGAAVAAVGVSDMEWNKTLKHFQGPIEMLVHVFNEYMLAKGFSGTFGLSPRETEVLKWVTCGMNKHEIADKLNISPRTAEVHTYRIREKLRCRNDAQVTAKALVFNMVD